MTRETKIGLLVGLAFIIVIGILLSDHLTSSTEPPQATLANAGNNVRSGVTTPGSNGTQPTAVQPPISVAPQQQVATQNELAPRPDPVQIVKVGPSNSNQPDAPMNSATPTENSPVKITVADGSSTNVVKTEQTTTEIKSNPNTPVATSDGDQPTVTKAPEIPARATLIDSVAKQHGEEIVALDSTGRAIQHPNAATAAKAGMVDYKVQPGDSLSKIASNIMGQNSKANRDAIVAANPSLKTNPDRVIVGKTYKIPSSSASLSKSAIATNSSGGKQVDTNLHPVTDAPANNPPTEVIEPVKPANVQTASIDEYWYTVKEGDSLWRIASDQCGKPSAMAAIKELNKDSLKGENHDVVIVGTKIKLPGKPVASAS